MLRSALCLTLFAATTAFAHPAQPTPDPDEGTEPIVIAEGGYTTVFDVRGRWTMVVSPQGATVRFGYDDRGFWPSRWSTDGVIWTAIAYAPNSDEERKARDFAVAMAHAAAAGEAGRKHANATEYDLLPPLPPPPILGEVGLYTPYLGSVEGYNPIQGTFDFFDASTWGQGTYCRSQCMTAARFASIGCGAMLLMPTGRLPAYLCSSGVVAFTEYCALNGLNC